jgi:hypothetical protein
MEAPERCGGPSVEPNDANMSDGNQFRRWATQVARQVTEEPDAAEVQRLLSLAEYWVRLADSEEFNQPVDDPR